MEGHTDKRPIKQCSFHPTGNYQLQELILFLNFCLKVVLHLNRLSAAGYGEFYPISLGETDKDYRQNRRIELKLTSR